MSGSMTGSHVGATRYNDSLTREAESRVIGGVFFSWVLHCLDKQKRSA